jgi:peptide chain release factor 1
MKSAANRLGKMFEQLGELVSEHADLEVKLADPAIHADQDAARILGQRYAELGPIVTAYQEWLRVGEDLATARELSGEDASFRAEAGELEETQAKLAEELRRLLLPTDPNDDKDVILEVQAGQGGDESALFAGDLLRMYLRYAERQGWKTEILDATESDLGGYKAATIAVRGRKDPKPWSRLKYEGGVHRVQRVPVTEAQGRLHTSAAGVLVLPEAEEVEVDIDPNDLRIDVYRSSGPGGQSVNTTDSAVRITHVPTGIVVSCQNEKSQLQNKERADADASAARRSQVRTVDRSERIRTYNFPENRISDHRVNFKAYNLDAVLDGELDAVVEALSDADTEQKMGNET